MVNGKATIVRRWHHGKLQPMMFSWCHATAIRSCTRPTCSPAPENGPRRAGAPAAADPAPEAGHPDGPAAGRRPPALLPLAGAGTGGLAQYGADRLRTAGGGRLCVRRPPGHARGAGIRPVQVGGQGRDGHRGCRPGPCHRPAPGPDRPHPPCHGSQPAADTGHARAGPFSHPGLAPRPGPRAACRARACAGLWRPGGRARPARGHRPIPAHLARRALRRLARGHHRGRPGALALCVQLLTNPGDHAWLEEPGYRGRNRPLRAATCTSALCVSMRTEPSSRPRCGTPIRPD